MLCKNDCHFDTNYSTTDKRLATTGGDYEARGLVAQAFFGGNLRIFVLFSRKKKEEKIKTRRKKCLIATRSVIPSYLSAIHQKHS